MNFSLCLVKSVYHCLHVNDCSPKLGVEWHLCSHSHGNREKARKRRYGEMYISTLTSIHWALSFPWEQALKDYQQLKEKLTHRLQLCQCQLRAASDGLWQPLTFLNYVFPNKFISVIHYKGETDYITSMRKNTQRGLWKIMGSSKD